MTYKEQLNSEVRLYKLGYMYRCHMMIIIYALDFRTVL